jgi:hypothetical protein
MLAVTADAIGEGRVQAIAAIVRVQFTERVQAGLGIFGLYPATDPKSLIDFAEWRKRNGR